ncbi:MAG: hypothetical protein CVU01_01275 [Bacteroidetes bacterium HGW-Bacteroidetes-18]|nr:MAG: hypothetical protein CVU01_01275 [Bacteroidetes bacterium HGW-Bacteroidetes-18]
MKIRLIIKIYLVISLILLGISYGFKTMRWPYNMEMYSASKKIILLLGVIVIFIVVKDVIIRNKKPDSTDL